MFTKKEELIIARVAKLFNLPHSQVSNYAWNIIRLDDPLTFTALKEETKGAIEVYY